MQAAPAGNPDNAKTHGGKIYNDLLAGLEELQIAAPYAHDSETPEHTPAAFLKKHMTLNADADGKAVVEIFIPFTANCREAQLESDVVAAVTGGFTVLSHQHLAQTEYETFDASKMETL